MARNILRDKVSLSVCVESDLHHFKTFLLQINGLKETINFICVSIYFYSGFAICACVYLVCAGVHRILLDKGACSSKHYFLKHHGQNSNMAACASDISSMILAHNRDTVWRETLVLLKFGE